MSEGKGAIAAYAEAAVRLKWVVFAAVALAIAASAAGLAKFEFKSTYRIWFAEDSPTIKAFDDMIDKFGSDGVALVVFRDAEEGVLNNRALGAIQRLTDKFWKVEGVKRVDSLANFATVRASRLFHESGAFAATDTWLAAAGDKNEVFVWDASTFERRTLSGHAGMVEHLSVGQGGSLLYSAGVDRSVRIWSMPEGTEKAVLRGAPDQISTLVATADDSVVLAGSFRSVTAWDAQAKLLWQREFGADYISQIVSDGPRVYAASRDIFVLDAKTGAETKKLSGHKGFVTQLRLSRDGKTLLSAGDDGRVLLWALDTGKSTELSYVEGTSVLSVAWSISGDAVIAGLSDGTVRSLPLDGAAPIVSHVHDDWVTDLVVAAHDRVFASSRDRKVSMHVPGQGPTIVLLEAHRAAARRVLLAGENRLYSLGDEGDVYVWDTRTQSIVARLNRSRVDPVGKSVPFEGEPLGIVDVANGFRYPIEVRINGQVRGTVDGGKTIRIDKLPVHDAKPCDDDASCGAGQYCDYEADEPVCAGSTVVEAFVPGTDVRVWAGESFLAPASPVVVRVPPDEPFSVTAVAKAPLDPRTRVGALREAFGSEKLDAALEQVLGDAASNANTFISPPEADAVASALGADESVAAAVKVLTTQAQVKLSPLHLPVQPHRLREARYHLMRPPTPGAKGFVLNDALDATMISVAVHQDDESKALERVFTVRDGVRAAVDAEVKLTGYAFELTGDVIQDTYTIEYAQRDLGKVLPLFMLVMIIMLIGVYRRLSGVFLPLGLVALSVVFAMGISAHLGASLNNMTVGVPQIVVAACIGDAVHIFNGYVDRMRSGISKHDAVIGTITANWAPCLWTTVSTAIGFFSLSWSGIGPVGTFGWMAGIGVIAAFIMSFTLMPGVMAVLPAIKPRAKGENDKSSGFDEWVDARMKAIANYVNTSTGSIIFMGMVFMVVSLSGLRYLSFDSNAIKFFAADSPFRRACNFIEDHISGPNALQLVLDTGEKGGVRKVEHMARVAKIRDHVWANEAVVGVQTLSDTMKSMNRVMNRDVDENYRVPLTDSQLSSYYNAYTFSLRAGMDITDRVNADESATRLTIRLKNRSSGWMLEWGDELLAWAKAELPGSDLRITGKTWLFSNMLSEISKGFFENVGSAVLLICFVMIFLTRSLALWLVSSFANIMPLAMTIGLISLTGESLDLSILASCCVAMGIIVDDSIHFMTKYKRLRAKGQTHEEATEGSIMEAGKAMVFTTFILVAGLSMFMLTDFALNRNFGMTVAMMLTIGMVFDLTMLPALTKVFYRGPNLKDA